jgi:hypothetical protein
MPTNRFQFSDDFVLNNGNVGINSSSPQEKLDVVGVVKGQDLKVTGVSSFTTYEGFLNSNQNIIENVSISNGSESGSLSGEIIVGTGITVSVSSGTTSSQGYIDSLKVYNTFTVPTGGTVDRPSKSTPGQLFYNKDFKTIEFWDGNVWRQVDNTTQSGRGVFGGGYAPGGRVSNIDYINISSQGNAIQFGSLTTNIYDAGGCSSSTRGLFGGGNTGPAGANIHNVIEYVTIASEGNSIDFGDISLARKGPSSCSSSTRGIWAGGYNPSPTISPFLTNVIDYVQISTLGNALDFGDITSSREQSSGCSSPTRGLIAGGIASGEIAISSINSITISSTGNAISFGDLTIPRRLMGAVSNSIRGVYAGGRTGSIDRSAIDFVTISSFGKAQDFGDLTTIRRNTGGVATQIRGVFAGGVISPTSTNQIDYITIASTGNAQDFGDLSRNREINGSCFSDSHGGLGGF